ncbi:uncharacterized protein LOC121867346 [Homarus americanus]|uniref:Leucine-rich repeat-containing protein 24-like n=1 Tax=Homarus americanus TaxID=6706 RepID=A0A8J5NCZ5_HOMAM|nr:uncharacterized protein LOC121867346 [Homarus americanus]XP_042223211.1 uncharacterized protein LOC121867346 [Homarus americanus]KAG7176983.1 Leucine-rich repeat-containing protein 24-like [Homarus americanus]
MCTSQGRLTSLYQPRTRTAFVWTCVWVWTWVGLGVWGGCPKVCECFWRDGKQMVACRDAQFIDIPRGIEPSTQVLDLSHNNLRILPRDSFLYTGLRSLQKVMLNHCNLILLEKGAFNGVENIMELDLSNNQLRAVPSAALMDMLGLRELRIAHNALTTIPASAFTRTPHIVQLDVSHNKLHTIERGAIRNLTELEILNLFDNKFTFLNASELEPLLLLRVIRVDGNPWHCDCRLKSLRQWFHDRRMAASVPPSCSQPKWLIGHDWQLLDNDEFICAPQVTAVAPRVLAAHGENVSLLCRVETEVETTVTWFIGDVPLYNDSELQRYLVVELMTANNMSYVSNLTITDVVSEDQGTYRCVAENRAGFRETNFTLQVSHEVAEVRVANIDVSYIKEGLLGGISILIFVLLLVCSIVYCKLRVNREQRQDEDSVETAQSSRSSDCDAQHKLAGYHVVPTSDLEESSPCRQQPDPSWDLRHRGPPGEFPPGNVLDVNVKQRQELPECAGAQAMASATVSFVENPKHEVCGIRHNPLEITHWKDMVCHKDIFLHRVCSRSVSQVSLGSGKQYPDLLDLPHPQLGVQLQQHMQLSEGGQELQTLAAASCSRPRTYSDAGCRTAAGVVQEVVVEEEENVHPLAHAILNSHEHVECNRSSSALNLALSQAASNAYANAHLPVSGHQCLPGAPLDTQHPQALRQVVTHRGDGAPAASNVCSQHHVADPCHFEYHAAQLEKFLKEYRCLQEQLIHMKQSYEAHKRAGSIPRLDCCTPNVGESLGSSAAVFPPGDPCCSCSLQAAFLPPSAVQPIPGNFAESSMAEVSSGGYPEGSLPPLSPAGFNEASNPQISSDGTVDSAFASGGYVDTSMPPSARYADSSTPQIQRGGYTDTSTCQAAVEVESPSQQSPARGSPSGKTSTRTLKEPLKSILKKSTDGGGRRRCDQWTRSAAAAATSSSCCDTQTPPLPPYAATDSQHPSSEPYPSNDPYPTTDSHTTSDPTADPTTTLTHAPHTCYDS